MSFASWLRTEKAHAKRVRARRHTFAPRLETLEDRLAPATFTVLNTYDAGPDSLRQAILDANINPGPDLIAFSIPGSGPHTITPGATSGVPTGLGGLPAITDPVTIDGRTQPGYIGSPLIELSGASTGPAHGLFITSGDSTVAGLVINDFSDAGVLLSTAGNNTIVDNYIGTDATGTAARGNGRFGVLIDNGSTGNQVLDNTISANAVAGVWILTNDNVVAGNKLGTDSSGTAALGNGLFGVFLGGGAQANIIGTDRDGLNDAAEGNVISGNLSAGVGITSAGTDGNVVAGNFIGTDPAGTVALPNGVGIAVTGGVGTQALDNVIAFNQVGVQIVNGSDGNQVLANTILGNVEAGVWIETNANVVSGNFIGTDAGGALALTNYVGMYFLGGVGNQALDNVMAFNTYGLVVDGSVSSSNVIQNNSVYSQVEAGIYLSGGLGDDAIVIGPGATPGVTTFLINGVIVADVANSGTLEIDGSEGSDSYAVTLGGLAVTIDVVDSGTSGSDALTVQGTSGPDAMTLTGSQVQNGAGTVVISSPIANLTVDGGGGADTTTITGFTAPTTNLTVDGTGGTNAVTIVGSPPPGVTLDLSAAVQTVDINVQPKREPNKVNLANRGVIPVVLYTTTSFNAALVDVSSVVFAGAHAAHSSLKDVDGDGDLDLVLHFRTQDTNLDTVYAQLLAQDINEDGVLDSNHQHAQVSLTGKTVNDVAFEGLDQLDLVLSGKELRHLLEALGAGKKIKRGHCQTGG